MSDKQLRSAFLIFFSGFCLWILWQGIDEMGKVEAFTSALKSGSEAALGNKEYEIGTLKIANVKAQDINDSNSAPEWKMYVSVLNLDQQTPRPLRDNILLAPSNQERKMYGLEGHPSFVLNKSDTTFWKWQFYLQILFYTGGYLIMGILFIIFNEMKFRNKKLFITPIKNIILSFALLFLFGIFIKWSIDWRLFNFLNDHYYLGENMPPLSNTLLYIGTPTFIFALYLEQAVHLQKEQDLTI